MNTDNEPLADKVYRIITDAMQSNISNSLYQNLAAAITENTRSVPISSFKERVSLLSTIVNGYINNLGVVKFYDKEILNLLRDTEYRLFSTSHVGKSLVTGTEYTYSNDLGDLELTEESILNVISYMNSISPYMEKFGLDRKYVVVVSSKELLHKILEKYETSQSKLRRYDIRFMLAGFVIETNNWYVADVSSKLVRPFSVIVEEAQNFDFTLKTYIGSGSDNESSCDVTFYTKGGVVIDQPYKIVRARHI